jgi:Arylsulfotransferase (ASST)
MIEPRPVATARRRHSWLSYTRQRTTHERALQTTDGPPPELGRVDRETMIGRTTAGVVAMVAVLTVAACTGSGNQDPPKSGHQPTQIINYPSVGTQLVVYPTAGSRAASPETQISFRNTTPDSIGSVTVVGSKSGTHSGRMSPDSDGDGASFYPTTPFKPGEKVTVTAGKAILDGNGDSYTFRVSRPLVEPTKYPDETNDSSVVQHFVSAPNLRPPDITVNKGALDPNGGDVFLAPKGGPGQDGPMIVDPSTKLLWFLPLRDGQRAYNFREQMYENQPVLTWWQGLVTPFGHGHGEGVIYNTNYQKIATVKAGNGYFEDIHEFTITPQNTALITIYEPVHWNETSIGGPKNGVVFDSIFEEIDIPTGNVLDEWHSLDHVPLNASYKPQVGKKAYDYIHINTLVMNSAGDILVSGRTTHTVYNIFPPTGKPIWELGGKHSSFTGPGSVFKSQHDATWLGPNLLGIFDNGLDFGNRSEKRSRAMIVRLNLTTKHAYLVHAYTDRDIPLATSQGDVELLPSGNVFVGWGSQRYLTQFTASGQLMFQASLPPHDSSYRTYRFAWSGQPLTQPSVVVVGRSSGATVHVSWNGATAVANWRMLAGDSSSGLVALNTVPRAGFDTAIALDYPEKYVQVQALSSAGTVLGTSAIMTVPA